jgi:6-phosphofructokinase 1
VDEIANFEKTVPLGWIDRENWGLREQFLTYARPLILGEVAQTYENGLPKHICKK